MSAGVFFVVVVPCLTCLVLGLWLGTWLCRWRMQGLRDECAAKCAHERARCDSILRQEREAVDEQRRQCLDILAEARAVNDEVLGKSQQPVRRPQGGVRWGRN
jgi:hypothetical protein